MKFPDLVDLSFSVRGLCVLAGFLLLMAAAPTQAQKIRGLSSFLAANPSADIDQCRNGATGTDPCVGNNWVNGNLGSQNSHYFEDEYVPYRIRFTNLTPGTNYTVIIGYDTVHDGKHAIDYLGGAADFKILNRLTETAGSRSVDACDGGVLCSGVGDLITVPQDPLVLASINPFTLGPVYEPSQRKIVLFGGTFTSIAYTANINSGDIEREITITFTANLSSAVMAWGGHVAWGGDWGIGLSAGGIQGSPYHMRIDGFGVTGGDISNGHMDRSMSADAVTVSATVNIIKVAQTVDGSGTAITPFPFTATPTFGPTSFNIVDSAPGTDGVLQQSKSITDFGAANPIVVNEENTSGWTLADITCSTSPGSSATAVIPPQPSAHAGTVTIQVSAGAIVTCTFTNSQLQVTAAPATVSGRVLSSNGMPLRGVVVTLTDASTGERRIALTSSFGYFVFDNCMTDDFYVINIKSRKNTFTPSSRSFTLQDNLADLDFIADP